MRAMAVLIGLMAVVAAGAFWAPAPAWACSCAMLAPETLVEQAPLVVVGTPVAAESIAEPADARFDIRYRVQVARSYRQAVPQQLWVVSSSQGPACGLLPELHTERIFVLAGSGDQWSATSCQNLGVTAQTLRVAGAPLAPLPGEDVVSDAQRTTTATVSVTVAVVVALAAGAAGAWALRRRRS